VRHRVLVGLAVLVSAAQVGASVPLLASAAKGSTSSAWLLTIGAVLVSLGLQVAGHSIRAQKHALILAEIRPVRRGSVFRGQMIGFLFNVLLPFRLGELVRAHTVGRATSISRSAVLATILFERFVDLLILGSLGCVALLTAPDALSLDAFGAMLSVVLVLLAGSSLIFACVYRRPRWMLSAVYTSSAWLNDDLRDRVRLIVWSFLHALVYCLQNRRLIGRYLALSVWMWLAYLGSVVVLAALFLPGLGTTGSLVASVTPFLGLPSVFGQAYAPDFIGGYGEVIAGFGSHTELGAATWVVLVAPSLMLGTFFAASGTHLFRFPFPLPDQLPRGTANRLVRDEEPSVEFSHFLATYFQGDEIGRVINREEARGAFQVLRTLKGGSHAVTVLAHQQGCTVIKKLTLPEYRSKLEAQFDWLRHREHLPQLPNALQQESAKDHYAIDIEFRDGFMPLFEYLHSAQREHGWSVLQRVLDFVQSDIYVPTKVNDASALLEDYLDVKVIAKVLDAAQRSKAVSQLIGYDTLVVNGVEVLNFHRALERLRRTSPAIEDLRVVQQTPIHGDLTVDNLLVNPITSEFLLLDPNNENLISDPVVDYAKLMQSLHSGYEFLVRQAVVGVEGNRVSFEEHRSAQYDFLYARLDDVLATCLTPAQHRSLLFHEAVHFCRMLTYRASIDPETVAMYYAISMRLLHDFLAQYERAAELRTTHTGGSAPAD
jgi:hypothetical protein